MKLAKTDDRAHRDVVPWMWQFGRGRRGGGHLPYRNHTQSVRPIDHADGGRSPSRNHWRTEQRMPGDGQFHVERTRDFVGDIRDSRLLHTPASVATVTTATVMATAAGLTDTILFTINPSATSVWTGTAVGPSGVSNF